MQRAGPTGGQAYTQLPRILGVRTGHEARRFFVPDGDKPDAVLALAQRLQQRVDAIANEPKDTINAPGNQPVKNNRGGCGHVCG